MQEALNIWKLGAKILAKKSNVMWDIHLTTDEEAKQLAGSVRITKSISLQIEYLVTRPE